MIVITTSQNFLEQDIKYIKRYQDEVNPLKLDKLRRFTFYMKIVYILIALVIVIFILMIIRLNIARIRKRKVKYIPYGKKKGDDRYDR